MNYTSWPRQWIAVTLSLLLVPFMQSGLYAQEPPPGAYAPLDAVQLNQLVAPIALYPDSLVAQVLTAATFADQVNDADNWLHQNGGMPPAQMAAAADSMPWDPSVKALTEFPTVLDSMARNNGWTAALGNAYYNQPGDVMNAVQAMRYQAQQAGTLRSTPQERVSYSDGLVVIEPVNPAFVYVPYYNPWTVWGTPIAPWGGYYWAAPRGVVFGAGLAIGFGVGIGIGLWGHYGWGYHAWGANWHGGGVYYNHSAYISRSTTVINRGHFGGYNRGVYEHGGRGVPGGYHAAYAHPGGGGGYHPGGAAHPGGGGGYHPGGAAHPGGGGGYHPGGAAHPGAGGGYHPGGASHPGAGGAYHPGGASHPGGGPASHPGGASHPGAGGGSHPGAGGGSHPGGGGGSHPGGGGSGSSHVSHAASAPAHGAAPGGGGGKAAAHSAPKGGHR